MTWDDVCAAWDASGAGVYETVVDMGRRGRRVFRVRPTADFFEYVAAWVGIGEACPDLAALPWVDGRDAQYRRAAADGCLNGARYRLLAPEDLRPRGAP